MRRLGTSALFFAILGSLMALVGIGSPTASATVGPNTSWSMRSDPGDFILGSDSYSYDATSGMQLQGDASRITGDVDDWDLTIVPATGDVLQAGRTYAGATRAPFHAANEPGLDLHGHGRGCNTLTGTFTITELTFDAMGKMESVAFSFEQHCEGFAAAAYGSIAWHASIAAPTLPPTLSMTLNKQSVRYGTKVKVQAQLSADSPIRQLSVYARTHGGTDKLVGQGTVDASGRLSFPVKVTESATITVRFQGGGTYPDRSASTTVVVAGKLKSGVVKGAKRGKFHLFKVGSEPVVGSLLEPDHAGDCITFRLQAEVGGTWGNDVLSKCLKLNKRSVTGVRIRGNVGVPLRVRPEWRGDARNGAATGPWVYLEFTR